MAAAPAMAVRPTILKLDKLANELRQREWRREELQLDLEFKSSLGPCFIKLVGLKQIDGGDDHWMGGYFFWRGAKEAAPADVPFAFELATVEEGGSRELLGCFGASVGDAWKKGQGQGTADLCKWSELRRALLSGCSLQMAVVLLPPSDAAATLDTALRIDNKLSDSALTAIGPMLDGPFTDVAVTAGGRTFRAHRVVLAAASPVFLSMLDGAMREAREAAVELVDADAGALELLLRHVYGCAIEVPVSLALQLYALADQYQLAAGLQQRLRLWLAALRLAPEALVELVPAARTLCPAAWYGGLCQQAASVLSQLSPLPAFAGWPVDAVVEVMGTARPLNAFGAVVAWMEAQPQPAADERDEWPRLLDAVPWAMVSSSDLWAMRQHPGAALVPGLQERLLQLYNEMCEAYAKAMAKDAATIGRLRAELRQQAHLHEQQEQQWQQREQQRRQRQQQAQDQHLHLLLQRQLQEQRRHRQQQQAQPPQPPPLPPPQQPQLPPQPPQQRQRQQRQQQQPQEAEEEPREVRQRRE
ncbi:hypothetical protein Rsub_08349 [Raphidocelis subcapitata]|uniref:BTB domain-containing protein n=1 Tax=Raphidocelis subcapitata TaxID=307507 RepID=A0A2V0PDY8_9CHLO|nr:hypothetical protein Rsub_08349 [Raphidocelis subcapitata]|eukprot:GBF95387.1 hypothetical protein Rsub_08349 [Raphidocelis subcapitata]